MTAGLAGRVAAAPRGLTDLVASLRDVVGREFDPAATVERVAGLLRPVLLRDDLLLPSHTRANASHYQQHVMHAEADGSFSIVSLVWLPGQRTAIHDHVAWCVVGVRTGREEETRYRVDGSGDHRHLVRTSTSTNPHGFVCGFAPPGDIHEVRNPGDGKAISIHVYGADIRRLGTSIRRRYALPVRRGGTHES